MMKSPQLDHIGIAVHDLDAAMQKYADLFACPIAPPEKLESRGISVAFVSSCVPHLELIGSDRPDSELAGFLEKRGEGIHHICLCVEDLASTVAQLQKKGLRLTAGGIRPGANGSLVAFVHPKDAHGVLLEYMQKQANA